MKSKNRIRGELRSLVYLVFGVSSATFGLTSFLIPNGFFDGGVMGISLLLSRLTSFELSFFILA